MGIRPSRSALQPVLMIMLCFALPLGIIDVGLFILFLVQN